MATTDQIRIDTRWDGTHIVGNDTIVEVGAKLVIEAGSQIIIDGNHTLEIQGTLEAIGTTAQPIVINASGPARNSTGAFEWWVGIILDGSSSIRMENVTIKNADTAIEIRRGVSISNISIVNSSTGIFSIGSGIHLQNIQCTDVSGPCVDQPIGEAFVSGISTLRTGQSIRTEAHLNLSSASAIQTPILGEILDGASGTWATMTTDTVGTALIIVGSHSALPASSDPMVFSNLNLQSTGLLAHFTDVDGVHILSANAVDTHSVFEGTINGDFVSDGITSTGMVDTQPAITLSGTGAWSLSNLTISGHSRLIDLNGQGAVKVSDSSLSGDGTALRIRGEWADKTTFDVNGKSGVLLNNLDISTSTLALDFGDNGTILSSGITVDSSSVGLRSSGNVALAFTNLNLNASTSFGRLSSLAPMAVSNSQWHASMPTTTGMVASDSTLTASNLSLQSSGGGSGPALAIEGGSFSSPSLAISAWGEGVECSRRCHLTATDLSVSGAVGSTSAINIDSSSTAIIENMTTILQSTPIQVESSSSLVLTNWTASNHDTSLILVGVDSTASIRNFPYLGTSSSLLSDGTGTLNYGTASPLTSTSFDSGLDHHHISESTITVWSQDGEVLANALVSSHGFTSISNSLGKVTLPLRTSGSMVSATINDTSTTVPLGTEDSPLYVVIIQPPSGNDDWVIGSGTAVVGNVSAVLFGRTVNLGGNATIQSGSSLHLIDSTLRLSPGKSLVIESGALLIGDGGIVDQGQISVNSSSVGKSGYLLGQGSGLRILSTLNIAAESPLSSTLTITGVGVESSFQSDVWTSTHFVDGHFSPTSVSLNGGSLSHGTSLSIEVLNQSAPIPFAQVELLNSSLAEIESKTTDTDGMVEFIEGRINVDYGKTLHLGVIGTGATPDVNVGSLGDVWLDSSSGRIWNRITSDWVVGDDQRVIRVSANGLTQLEGWNLADSSHLTIHASTLPSLVNSWTVLESKYSPYVVNTQLVTVSATGDLTAEPGASVYLSTDATIDVRGAFSSELAVFQPFPSEKWSGISVQGDGTLSINGGQIIGTRTAISLAGTGNSVINNARISNAELALIHLSNSASISITNTVLDLSLSDGIHLTSQASNSEVSLSQVEISGCSGSAIMAQSGAITGTDVEIGANNDQGIKVLGGSLSINGLDAEMHSGTQPALSIISSDSISIDSANLSGMGSTISEIKYSTNVLLKNSRIMSNDGIGLKISSSELTVDGLALNGTSIGKGILVEERMFPEQSIILSHIQADGIGAAIYASLTSTESYAPPIEIIASDLSTSTVHTIGAALRIVGGNVGVINASGTHVTSIDLVDVERTDVPAITEMAVLTEWSSVSISLRGLGGIFVDGSVEATVPSLSWTTVLDLPSGMGRLEIPRVQITSSQLSQANQLWLNASGDDHLLRSINVVPSPPADGSEWEQVIALSPNNPPIVILREPTLAGQKSTHHSGENITFHADIIDDEPGNVDVEWIIMDGSTTMYTFKGNPVIRNNLIPGEFSVTLTATDSAGKSYSVSFGLQVLAPDNDGDAQGCPLDGFNESLGYDCGPDATDLDDDNDGVPDVSDDFPMDACASKDLDEDGLPDHDNFKVGCATTLVKDLDDDNDGVNNENDSSPKNKDVQSISETQEESSNIVPIAIAVVIIIAAAVIVLLRRN